MREILIIGNKPYTHLDMMKLLDSFEFNHRCNMALPNKNNGSILDNLALCAHLYENLIIKKLDSKEFIQEYMKEYKEDQIEDFLLNFNPLLYNKIYYADNFEKNTQKFNKSLEQSGCPYKFSKMPRTGYTSLFENLIAGEKVFVSNFSIYDEERVTYYVKPEKYENLNYHSKEEEVLILGWLHNNGKIDASLCLLDDTETANFNCKRFSPTIKIIDLVLESHGKCLFKDLQDAKYLDDYDPKISQDSIVIYKR